MIAERIKITVGRRDFSDDPDGEDQYNATCNAEIIMAADRNSPDYSPVRLEVEYKNSQGEYPPWDESGDAVEVTWPYGQSPIIKTFA